MNIENLELDLFENDWIANKCKDRNYAVDLYGAMCNNRFFKNKKEWTASWRMAGGIVADLRKIGEDYLDFYCSGNEGEVTEEIREDLSKLGWVVLPYEPRSRPGVYRNEW